MPRNLTAEPIGRHNRRMGQWSKMTVQWSRPLLYGVYFVAGLGIGAQGVDCGLTAVDGALARRWALWLSAALASLFLWMGLTYLTMNGGAPLATKIAADLSFVLACAAGCFFLLAASLRFGARRSRILGDLSANAYSLYLVHYVFSVWMQYALLPLDVTLDDGARKWRRGHQRDTLG